MKHLLLLAFSISINILSAQNQLIPQPKKLELKQGEFVIPETLLISKSLPQQESNYLINRLKGKINIEISKDNLAQIQEVQINKIYPDEWYSISIDKNGIF